jgi:4-aminobutyrate aminotransferase-like enzyme
MQGPVPHLVTAIPGPRSLALWEREQAVIAPGLQSVTQWARVCFSHGDGCVLYDVDGNAILDFMAGIAVCSIGHGHPAHARAIAEQAGRLAAGSFTSEARVRLLERLRGILPEHLSRIQLYSGGVWPAGARHARRPLCQPLPLSLRLRGALHAAMHALPARVGRAREQP